jgi:hypothetical protein
MPRAVALLRVLVAAAPLSCGAGALQPGLANAPALRTDRVADASVHDVVSNSRDSCGRALGPGPLWNEWPRCPGVELKTATPPVVGVVSQQPGVNGIVMPWVEHYYLPVRATCLGPEYAVQPTTLVGRDPRYATLKRALTGRACDWSL